MSTDWFAHSCFVPATARRTVSRELDHYRAEARQLLLDIPGSPRNLYISGSLARREPAVTGGGACTLGSDVDLVLVTESRAEGLLIEAKLKDALQAGFPLIDTSVFTVQLDRLPSVRGMFGHDLLAALADPIVEQLAVPAIGGRSAPPQEMFEVFVHAMSNAFFAGLLQNDSRDIATKLALEGLRCALSPALTGPVAYGDIRRHGELLSPIVDRDTIDALIKARELGLKPDLPGGHRRLVACAAAYFLGPSARLDTAGLLGAIEARIDEFDGLMNSYQMSMPLAHVIAETGDATAISLLSRIWQRASRRDIAEEEASLRAADRLASLSAQAPARITEDLFTLRRDYYRLLSAHNFGVRHCADYVVIRHAG
ncbi:hypothetical protein ACIBQ6_34780 [Nonomuraea sp. NPDC049655]|uniref:hypothetical protein n=1 Tax=Nonomuraea sp. NPDC049655 TaxID=3364355 RepID=UPI0037AE7FE3